MKQGKKSSIRKETRAERRANNKNLRNSPMDFVPVEEEYYQDQKQINIKPIYPIGKNQALYQRSFIENTITFGIGVTGTGKSFLAGDFCAQQLRDGKVDKIIFIRPLVEAGNSVGALPGEMDDKTAPFMKPFMKILYQRLGRQTVGKCIRNGKISAECLNYLRGDSFDDCIAVLDEAENVTPKQMEMFLTRLGENCKLIINGDIRQSDLYGPNGLKDVIDRFKFSRVPEVGIVEFTIDDIVRNGLIRAILLAYYA